MLNKYELIQFEKNILSKIFLHKVNIVPNHWHDSLEILFLLDGEVILNKGSIEYKLKKEDVVVINPNEVHTIKSLKDNMVLALQIDKQILKESFPNKDIRFECNSASYDYETKEFKKLDILRKLLSRLFYVYDKRNNGFEIFVKGVIFEILFLLLNDFQIEVKTTTNTSKYMDRLTNITLYIKEHFKEDISLNDVAESQYVTPQYFSSFFKKNMGISFLSYLSMLRLQNAVYEMEKSSNSITDIAINSGFKNIQSFIKVFKENYNETPLNYKKVLEKKKKNIIKEDIYDEKGYLDFSYTNRLGVIYKYVNYNVNATSNIITKSSVLVDYGEFNLSKTIKNIKHTWRDSTSIGKLKEVLYTEVRDALKLAKRDIGFRYVKFHGLLEDELGVYRINEEGEEIYNFSFIDKAIETLLELGLKPFAEIGFMPRDLALNPEYSHFYKKSILSKPKSIESWNKLINNLFMHLIDRFSLEEVKSWRFEFWNEPDLNFRYWRYDISEFFDFYKETYNTVKKVNSEIKIGGGAVIALCEENNFLKEFLKYTIKENCIPDIVTFHVYPMDVHEIDYGTNGKKTKFTVFSENTDYLSFAIDRIKSVLDELGLGKKPLHITEFNSSCSHTDLVNDTCYKGSYLARNITKNLDKVQSFTYWLLTDYHEENAMSEIQFHGGLGLITNKSIKKAGYNVMTMIAELGDKLIEVGEGYCITKERESIKIIIYNYNHYDKSYCLGDISNISYNDRYNVFEKNSTITVNMTLNNIDKAKYIVTTKLVGREYGSSYDFVNTNFQEPILKSDVDYINSMSKPLINKKVVDIEGSYKIEEVLKSNEVKLIIIERKF